MTVKQLLSSLDSRELTEWMAYFKLENERAKESSKIDNTLKNSLRGYSKR
jgi:hypothetical protein